MADAPESGEKVTEQLLDGQQRLTALWRSLHDKYEDRSYLIGFEDDPGDGSGNRQEFVGRGGEPFFPSPGLALGTSAIAAGLENEVLVGTMITPWEACAQIQDLADQIHTLSKRLAGMDPQIEVRITVKTKADGDLSLANSFLEKIKSGWKL